MANRELSADDYLLFIGDFDPDSSATVVNLQSTSLRTDEFKQISDLAVHHMGSLCIRSDTSELVGWKKPADLGLAAIWSKALALPAEAFLPPMVNTEALAGCRFIGMEEKEPRHVEIYCAWLYMMAGSAILQGNCRLKEVISKKFVDSLSKGLKAPGTKVGFSPAVQAVMIVLSSSIRGVEVGHKVRFGQILAVSVVGLMIIILSAKQAEKTEFWSTFQKPLTDFHRFLFSVTETDIMKNGKALLAYPSLLNSAGVPSEKVEEMIRARVGTCELPGSPLSLIENIDELQDLVTTWGHAIATYLGDKDACEKYCKNQYKAIDAVMKAANSSPSAFGAF